MMAEILLDKTWSLRWVLWYQIRKGMIQAVSDNGDGDGEIRYQLTELGRRLAVNLVRSHRLWESYLEQEAGVSVDRLHDTAERLEHFTDEKLRRQLDETTDSSRTDPHGTPIPDEAS
ncbi:MAG: iron dependent repressor, metal binding and dimerization domain protein [Planctomycetota bacterium]